MSTITFDTFEAMQNLQKAGIPEKQAKAMVGVLKDTVGEQVSSKADIARLEEKIETEIAKSELRMTIRLGGIMVTGIGVMVALQIFG